MSRKGKKKGKQRLSQSQSIPAGNFTELDNVEHERETPEQLLERLRKEQEVAAEKERREATEEANRDEFHEEPAQNQFLLAEDDENCDDENYNKDQLNLFQRLINWINAKFFKRSEETTGEDENFEPQETIESEYDETETRPNFLKRLKAKFFSKREEEIEDEVEPEGENDDEDKDNNSNKTKIIIIATLVALIIICIIANLILSNKKDIKSPSPSTSSATVSSASTIIHNTCKMITENYGENRWFSNGIEEIKNAKTDEEAREAANVWLDRVKRDANLMVGAAKYLLNRDVDKAALVSEDGWATDETVSLAAEMQILLAQSKITAEQAPVDGTNTGVKNGNVTDSNESVISGNRDSIKITEPNNEVTYVMGRCGNVVKPKDPTKDPAKKGNAPIGSGTNQDSGPGTYVPPDKMITPPAEPRVNPKPPSPNPTPTLAPDISPLPEPQPSAPTPDDPATGYAPPPGG